MEVRILPMSEENEPEFQGKSNEEVQQSFFLGTLSSYRRFDPPLTVERRCPPPCIVVSRIGPVGVYPIGCCTHRSRSASVCLEKL